MGSDAASPQTAQHTRKAKARKLFMISALDVGSELQLLTKNLEMKVFSQSITTTDKSFEIAYNPLLKG